MPPRRRVPTRLHPTSSDELEQGETGQVRQSEIQELRAMVAQLGESNRRQERRIDQLLAQRGEPSRPVQGTPSSPVVPPLPPAPFFSSGALGAGRPLTPAEEEQVVARLIRFRSLDPPRFTGRDTEPWEVEAWVAALEKLFRDLLIPESQRVHMAVHCLDGDADAWWRRVEPAEFQITRQMPWLEFRQMLFGAYFSNSVRQKLEEDLRNLQQGDGTVQEYLREFTRLLNCVPFVARDESHRVYMFEGGLRSEIYTLVHAQRLQTLDEVIERALWVERGDVVVASRAGMLGQSSERERLAPEDERQASGWGPSGPQRSQLQGHSRSDRQGSGGPQQRRQRLERRQRQQYLQQHEDRCVICGGPHLPSQCDHRRGRCFSCGQTGHFQTACPRVVLTVLPLATAPPLPPQEVGAPPIYRQADRATTSQQTEWRPPAPSG